MRRRTPAPDAQRSGLIDSVGFEVVRFQEASNTVDTVAAAILAVDRRDLPCITLLLFGGPASPHQLATILRIPISAARDTVARLELAGYARRISEMRGARVELTEHARELIARIWEPLRLRGQRMLAQFTSRDLSMVEKILRASSELQESHAEELARLLEEPRSSNRRHQRGGLSPAALRRVQLFVESRLDQPLHMADLAQRAGLSLSHFARAFRTTTAITPRAFVQQRRVARAQTLIEETDQSLAEVAVATGFATQSQFTTAFRRTVGFTPAVYRRSCRS